MERETQEFIADYVTRQPKSRNAQLASLEVIQHRVSTKNLTTTELLSECKIYFDRNSNKLYCFHDLRRYLATLDSNIQEEFLDYISNTVNPEAESREQEVWIDRSNGLVFFLQGSRRAMM